MPSRESNHPLPHFHAKYGGERVSIAIGTLEVLAGKIPAKELAMVEAGLSSIVPGFSTHGMT